VQFKTSLFKKYFASAKIRKNQISASRLTKFIVRQNEKTDEPLSGHLRFV
jgi:hypothetical protein